MGSSARSIVFLSLTVLCTVSGQLLMKKGIPTGSSLSLAGIAGNRLVLIGCSFYVASLWFWLNTLRLLPLSVAYPSASLSYLLVTFAAAIFLGEAVSLNKLIGVLLICGGVFFIGRG
jgi:multidrug transporter EmrE-like cation transporter